MSSPFAFVVSLLQTALVLLGIVHANPNLPQAQIDQANQVAQQAITQATEALASQQHSVSVPTGTNSSDRLEITAPGAGGKVVAGESMTVEWMVPKAALASLPSDFSAHLFLSIVRSDAPDINLYSIGDGNNPYAGVVTWKVPSDAAAGSYKVVGHLQATPKDSSRMCNPAYSTRTDCMPSPADIAVMQRFTRIKGESGVFAIGSSLQSSADVVGCVLAVRDGKGTSVDVQLGTVYMGTSSQNTEAALQGCEGKCRNAWSARTDHSGSASCYVGSFRLTDL